MHQRRIIAIVTVVVLTGSALTFGAETENKNGVPYTIWDAFNDLYRQVQAIQLIPGPAGPQGPQGIQGPRGEQGLPGEGAMRVVDSNGQTVGALLSQTVPSGYEHLAVVRTGSQLIVLPVNSAGFRDNYVSALYHTTPDCTGQRYLLTPGADPALTIASMQPAAVQRGYAVFPSGAVTVQLLSSRETFVAGSDYRAPGLCEVIQLTSAAAPARGFELATLQHVGPFRIE